MKTMITNGMRQVALFVFCSVFAVSFFVIEVDGNATQIGSTVEQAALDNIQPATEELGQSMESILENNFYMPKPVEKNEPASDATEAVLNLNSDRPAQCGIQAHALAMRTGMPLDCSAGL